MTEDEFLTVVRGNPVVDQVLDRLSATGLKDAWLVAGCLFQTVWNQQTGRPPEFGITDYDVFYFDTSDLSWEAEDEAIQRALQELGEVDADIEIRNQARVHLWYEANSAFLTNPCLAPQKASTGFWRRRVWLACERQSAQGTRSMRHKGLGIYRI